MKKIHLIILLSVMNAAFSCKPGETETKITNKSRLAGTWKLIEYSDFDSVANKWTHP